jgi:hypothetical protein
MIAIAILATKGNPSGKGNENRSRAATLLNMVLFGVHQHGRLNGSAE